MEYYLYICTIIIHVENDAFLQIMAKKTISIIGVDTELTPVRKSSLRGLDADVLINRKLYVTTFNNERLYILHDDKEAKSTPAKYKQLTEKLENVTEAPVAVWLESLKYFERKRLLEQGVYFIISGEYAFLPSLMANSRVKKETDNSAKLSSVAQYIILFYLLESNDNTFTINKLQERLPYNYLAVSRGIIQLEDFNLCHSEKGVDNIKKILFLKDKQSLWEKASLYMTSPVKKTIYTNKKPENFPLSGLDALSVYSGKTVKNKQTYAIWDKTSDSKSFNKEKTGEYSIEIWKYPSVSLTESSVVDKLSLYLSLRDNPDKNIRKESESLLKSIKW